MHDGEGAACGGLITTLDDFTRYVAFHEQSHKEMERLLEERAAWALGLDRELNEARRQKAALESRLWVKAGRKLGRV